MSQDSTRREVSCDVVIPTMGRPDVARAVESVLSQTIECRAIVVVADPNAKEAVAALLGDRPSSEVKIVCGRTKLNGSAARNLGARRADAEWIAFLDDDDWWQPEKVETQLASAGARQDTSRVVSMTAYSLYPEKTGTRTAPKRMPKPIQGSYLSYMISRPNLMYGSNMLQTSSILVRREVALRCPWDESRSRHQDWQYLWMLLDVMGMELDMVMLPLTNVWQGGPSVSRVPSGDALGSLEWIRSHTGAMYSNDFILVEVLPRSICSRDWRVCYAAIRSLSWSRTHPAAFAVFLLKSAKCLVSTSVRAVRKGTGPT